MINGTPAPQWGKPTENAVDGNASTLAQSTTGAPWSLQVDLGAVTPVGRVAVNPDWENYPVSYNIKISENGTDWTTMASEANSSGTSGCAAHGVAQCGQLHSYTFPQTKARYVLLSVNNWVSAKTGAPATGYGWALREFEVYAK